MLQWATLSACLKRIIVAKAGSLHALVLQEASEQARSCKDGQRTLQQEIDTLRGEIDASTHKLEAKRTKKRKWKELYRQQEAACSNMAEVLRDKQFALEKAVLRFAATDARIKAAEIFQEEPREARFSSNTEGVAVVHELEQALAKKQQDRQELQETLQSHKLVRPSSCLSCIAVLVFWVEY